MLMAAAVEEWKRAQVAQNVGAFARGAPRAFDTPGAWGAGTSNRC